jgi:hypothetical protein
MTVVVVLALAALVAWWVCTSLIRLAAAAAVAALAHPAIVLPVTALAVAALTAAVAVMVYRSCQACGWRLMVNLSHPTGPAPASLGGGHA